MFYNQILKGPIVTNSLTWGTGIVVCSYTSRWTSIPQRRQPNWPSLCRRIRRTCRDSVCRSNPTLTRVRDIAAIFICLISELSASNISNAWWKSFPHELLFVPTTWSVPSFATRLRRRSRFYSSPNGWMRTTSSTRRC